MPIAFLALVVVVTSPVKGAEPAPTGARSFRMGFTGFVTDYTLEAVMASRKFVREQGDIICHHIEGVPWTEALGDMPLPKAIVDDWTGKKSGTPPGGKVYLAISPGRGDLKPANKAPSIPAELNGKGYDDSEVQRAYLNYCRRSIEFFRPDYLAIGIEVNEIHSAGPDKWRGYASLHRYIYAELKKEHPNVPIFASLTLHQMYNKRGEMLTEVQKLLDCNDLIAVSYYPFFINDSARLSAVDWLLENFDRFNKPYAITETNDAAERLSLPGLKLVIEGTPEKQTAYYEKLLSVAQQRQFVFVISFIHQDYDVLWERIKSSSPEFFGTWRDCGLLDEKGNPRPAFDVWKAYFALPLKP
ncbi:MAG: hypothetical protein ACT4QC_21075 [Planctomycetaceae bacterium]